MIRGEVLKQENAQHSLCVCGGWFGWVFFLGPGMVSTRLAVITCAMARGLAGTSGFEVEGSSRSQRSVFGNPALGPERAVVWSAGSVCTTC